MKTSSAWFGDIAQVLPGQCSQFGGCYMFVQDVKDWGVLGYVNIPGAGLEYIEKEWHQIEWAGQMDLTASTVHELSALP